MGENVERQSGQSRNTDDPDPPADPGRPAAIDRLLSALASEHRRAVLRSLTDASDGTLQYDTLVDCVVDRVRDGDARPAYDEHRSIRIALHHAHLPKLEAAGMIEYEADTGHVRFVGGDLEHAVLTLVESHEATE